MGIYEFKKQDAVDFARSHGKYKNKHNELVFDLCPYCHGGKSRDKETFAINTQTGQFVCHRASCGATGNMLTLAKDFDYSLGRDYEEYYTKKKTYKQLKQPEQKIIPKENAISYLQNRGISKEIIEKYQITCRNDNENILVFPFFDENNVMQFIKYRDTKFIKGSKGNKEWCESDCKPILYGMSQCNDKFDRIIITEGQIDSLSLSECGIENAVSVPTGANGFTWIPHVWDWFCKFKEIVVFGDYEKGKMTILDEMSKRFKDKTKHVRFEDYKDCKDANELLQKYGKQSVMFAVENAISIPLNRVIELADVEKVDIYNLPKLETGIYELDRILKGGLYFGQVDIIAGKRGDGKSTLAGQIAINAIEQGFTTFAYSGELPNYLFKAWIDMQIAGDSVIESVNKFQERTYFVTNSDTEKINDWYRGKFLVYDKTMVLDEDEDLLKTIESVIVRYGVKVILIDNLMTAIDLDCSNDPNKWERQSNFMKKLTRIVIKYDVIALLVAHRRKSQNTNDINDEISGSGDITNLAGVVVSYDRNEEQKLPGDRLLKVTKSRLIGRLNNDGISLYYDEKSKRIYGDRDDAHRVYSWKKTDEFVKMEQSSLEDRFENPFV